MSLWVLLILSACTPLQTQSPQPSDEMILAMPDPIVVIEPRSKRGNPDTYQVFGKTYHVMDNASGFVQQGIASWYGSAFHGKETSNGDIYDMYRMTAAHKTIPIPAYVRVIDLDSGKSIIVRVNDRGPFIEGRIIDLSYAAARKLGIANRGTANVEIRVLDGHGRNSTNVVVDTVHDMQSLQVINHLKPDNEINQTSLMTAIDSVDQPHYYIQLGAFSALENARRLQGKLEMEGHSLLQLSQVVQENVALFRVRMGPFLNKKQATLKLDTLSRYPRATVIKE